MILKDIKVSGWRSFSPEYPITTQNLGHVNLLIGANNVGKSNLGRFLVKLRDCLQDFRNVQPWDSSTNSNTANAEVSWARPLSINFPLEEIDCWLRDSKDIELKAEIGVFVDALGLPVSCPSFMMDCDVIKSLIEIRKIEGKWLMSIVPIATNGKQLIIRNDSYKLLQEDGTYTEQVTSSHTHRGLALAVCRCLANSIIEIKPLRDPSRKSNYNNKSTDGGNIIEMLKEKQNDKNQQGFWTEYRNDLENWFAILLGEQQIRIEIKDVDFGIELIRNGKRLHCELPDLGAGVSEILMLLAYLRLHHQQSFCVVVDEPEAHLHPGAVVELANIITKNIPSHQLIITTHSTTLIDAVTPNWRTFRVRRDYHDGTVFEKLDTNHNKLSLLADLGIRPSQLFLARVALWVEGPSDIHYWLALLHEADEKLINGRDFSFITYGGASSSHLDFDASEDEVVTKIMRVLKVSHRAVIICDRDRNYNEDDRKLVSLLKEAAAKLPQHARVEISVGREIENSVKPEVLKRVLEEIRPKRFNKPELINIDYADYFIGKDDAFDNVVAEAARNSDGTELTKEQKEKIKQRLNQAKNRIADRIREIGIDEPIFCDDAIHKAKEMATWLRADPKPEMQEMLA